MVTEVRAGGVRSRIQPPYLFSAGFNAGSSFHFARFWRRHLALGNGLSGLLLPFLSTKGERILYVSRCQRQGMDEAMFSVQSSLIAGARPNDKTNFLGQSKLGR